MIETTTGDSARLANIGLIAIDRLATRGNEMLAEFEIVDGTAKRKR
jgi:hypothetical protein